MKRVLVCFLAVLVTALGCAKPGTVSFVCTQEQVCGPLKVRTAYDFFRCARDTGFVIPGLRQNFIPQGLAYWEARDQFLISGYFMPLSGGSASALLVLDGTSGQMVGEYTLTDDAGRELGGHFSGVAVAEADVFVTGGSGMYRIEMTEFDKAGAKGALYVRQELHTGIAADSCSYSQGILWVGEYYHPQSFPLDGTHVIRCEDGTRHHAWVVGYSVTDTGLEPKYVFSVPDQVQGICVTDDGRIALSRSYGRTNPSYLALYNDPRKDLPDGYVELEGKELPLWQLDSRRCLARLTAPPMSEGCCGAGDGIYLIFESAAYYYYGLDPDNLSVDPTDTIWFIGIKNRAAYTALFRLFAQLQVAPVGSGNGIHHSAAEAVFFQSTDTRNGAAAGRAHSVL